MAVRPRGKKDDPPIYFKEHDPPIYPVGMSKILPNFGNTLSGFDLSSESIQFQVISSNWFNKSLDSKETTRTNQPLEALLNLVRSRKLKTCMDVN